MRRLWDRKQSWGAHNSHTKITKNDLYGHITDFHDCTQGKCLQAGDLVIFSTCNFQEIKEKRERECLYELKVRPIWSFIDSLAKRPDYYEKREKEEKWKRSSEREGLLLWSCWRLNTAEEEKCVPVEDYWYWIWAVWTCCGNCCNYWLKGLFLERVGFWEPWARS